ncbi:hypothetical protein QUA71_07000 [Microcoleus sp. MON1_C5]|uniref:hypothetical protein n=1 Tax=Microcoleus sp. MON1_C5 TaxID=2818828 RepID=UPI002FD3803A
MNLWEAYSVLESPAVTLKELLEAHRVVAIEHGYLLAIVTRHLQDAPGVEPKLWKLLLILTKIETKIESKINL